MIRHGTDDGYTNHGCRCDDCRAAHAAYSRQYRSTGYLRRWRARRRANGLDARGRPLARAAEVTRCQLCDYTRDQVTR